MEGHISWVLMEPAGSAWWCQSLLPCTSWPSVSDCFSFFLLLSCTGNHEEDGRGHRMKKTQASGAGMGRGVGGEVGRLPDMGQVWPHFLFSVAGVLGAP